MKKLLFVFVLGAFAACGNGGSTETTDSTAVSVDTTTMAPMTADTTMTMGADSVTMDTTTMSTPH